MSEDGVHTGSAADQATPAKGRARPAQWKLLISVLVMLAVAGGKIYYDRYDWWQVMQPLRHELSGPRVTPVSEGFHPVQVVREFEPITDAPFVSAEEANQKLGEAELVLGVVVGDEARAYPINMLTGPSREIINDTLGGRAIAATW